MQDSKSFLDKMHRMGKKEMYQILILVCFCLILSFFGINSFPLTDPDDVFYTETAREMLSLNEPLVPHIFEQPHFEKPPFFFWTLMLSYKLFGVNDFSSRLIPSIMGLLGILGTYFFLRKLFGSKVAFLSSAVLSSALAWIGLSRVVVTDLMFIVFLTFALYSFLLWFNLGKVSYLYWFALFCSLASLTKTPLGMLLPVVIAVVFLAIIRDYKKIGTFLIHPWWGLYLLLTLPWFIYIWSKFGGAFYREYFIHDHWHRFVHAEHAGFDNWHFYPAVILIGMFPWTGYLAFFGQNYRKYRNWYLFLFTWIFIIFIFFSLAHSKLSTYICPLLPALVIGIGLALQDGNSSGKRSTAAGILTVLFGLIFAGAAIYCRFYYSEYFVAALTTMGALSISSIVAGIYLIRKKWKKACISSGAGILIFSLCAILVLFPTLKTALSDSDLKDITLRLNYSNKPIVCSKLYVRGVYYYTQNPVVVISDKQNPFWSQHPVKVLSNDGEIRDLFEQYDSLLCVVSKGGYEDIIKNLFIGERESILISRNIDRYVVLSIKLLGKPPTNTN